MKKTYRYVLFGIILFIALFLLMQKDEIGSHVLQPSIASKILRFHVLANSDETDDQNVKEKVRDAVGGYLQPYLKNADCIEKTKEIVNENMEDIIFVAKKTLKENGYNYDVQARITRTEFPEKSYGPYTFPSGEYEALQIVIGEGKGQNWWCVLYPNMCFRGAVFEVVEEEAKEVLKEVLSPWEYAKVFNSGKTEVRFKFLELFR